MFHNVHAGIAGSFGRLLSLLPSQTFQRIPRSQISRINVDVLAATTSLYSSQKEYKQHTIVCHRNGAINNLGLVPKHLENTGK